MPDGTMHRRVPPGAATTDSDWGLQPGACRMTYDETALLPPAARGEVQPSRRNALAADHTDTGVVRSPIFPHVQGVVNIQGSYRALFTMFPDWQITFEPPIIDGDRAAHPFTARATHVGEFMGMPGTGRKFQIVGALLYRLR